jgi:hypothetical protein
MKAGCCSLSDDSTTVRTTTAAQFRQFYIRNGYKDVEKWVRRACEHPDNNVPYVPPLEYSTPLSDPGEFERFWCEA